MNSVKKYGRKCQEIHLLSNHIIIKAKLYYELFEDIRDINKINGYPL